MEAGADVGFVNGEDEDFVIGEEFQFDRFGKGEDVELPTIHGLVIHGADGDIIPFRRGLGHFPIDARGGGHVEAFGGADVGVVVDFDKGAFVLALERGAGGAVGFVADDKVDFR